MVNAIILEDLLQYKVRLRVFLAKAFSEKETELIFTAAGKEVKVTPQTKDGPLSESKWVVFSVGGFVNEAEATAFGHHLKKVIEIAGLYTMIGIDVGKDKPTGSMSEAWARDIGLIKPEERLWPNLHGLLVMPDDELNRIPIVSADASVRGSAAGFFEMVATLAEGPEPDLDEATKQGLRFLNLAILSLAPRAQIVLAIAAIEAIGQERKWTDWQSGILERLATEVAGVSCCRSHGHEVKLH